MCTVRMRAAECAHTLPWWSVEAVSARFPVKGLWSSESFKIREQKCGRACRVWVRPSGSPCSWHALSPSDGRHVLIPLTFLVQSVQGLFVQAPTGTSGLLLVTRFPRLHHSASDAPSYR